jgi:hypothetical protein
MSIEEKHNELNAMLAFPESVSHLDVIKASNLGEELGRGNEVYETLIKNIVPSQS